jgi:hypothetical protein
VKCRLPVASRLFRPFSIVDGPFWRRELECSLERAKNPGPSRLRLKKLQASVDLGSILLYNLYLLKTCVVYLVTSDQVDARFANLADVVQ